MLRELPRPRFVRWVLQSAPRPFPRRWRRSVQALVQVVVPAEVLVCAQVPAPAQTAVPAQAPVPVAVLVLVRAVDNANDNANPEP